MTTRRIRHYAIAAIALITVAAFALPYTQGSAFTLPLFLGASPQHATSHRASGLQMLPRVYYQDDSAVYAVNPDGTNQTIIATLPSGTHLQSTLLNDGRLLYPAGNGFAAVDAYNRRSGIQTPSLQPNESVWSVMGSPDSHTLAWQLFTPSQVGNYFLHQGVSRIVITGEAGGSGNPVLVDGANSGVGGQVLSLMGWRANSSYGTGDATLLLQDLYSFNNASARLVANTRRGLIEYDPAINDVVNDYLPPMAGTAPLQRGLTVSQDGKLAVYGDGNSITPSGEGPLAQTLTGLNLETNTMSALDTVKHYPSMGSTSVTQTVKVGKKIVAQTKTVPLRLYQYFSHNAFIAPDGKHVLYTLLTVSYPPGATVPHTDRQAMVVQMDGRGDHTSIASGAEGEGWLNARMAVVKEPDGLYAVDIATGKASEIVADAQAHLIGVRS